MQVSVELAQGLERRMKVQVPADTIQQEVETRLKKVGRTAKLKGFRPGRVPPGVIRQRYGGQVHQEVIQDFLQSSFSQAVQQENLRPAGGPRIEAESTQEGDGLTYTAVFEVYPEFELQGLDKLKTDQPVCEVSDEEVDEVLESLRGQRRAWEPVDREAQEGDQVTLDFQGTRDGEPFEGGSGTGMEVVLGEGQLLEDFESNLLGLSAGEEKEFPLTFPSDYHNQELAGQAVTFTVKASAVSQPQLPEVDEEFIKSYGVESGQMDDFRSDLRDNMGKEARNRGAAEAKRNLMDQLTEANPVELPQVLVDQETRSLQQETAQRMGVSDESAMPPEGEFRDAAERRVRLGLIVSALLSEQNIQLDQRKVRDKVDQLCAGYEKPDEMRQIYFQNSQLLQQIESAVLEEQVTDWLFEKAEITEKRVPFKELMNG